MARSIRRLLHVVVFMLSFHSDFMMLCRCMALLVALDASSSAIFVLYVQVSLDQTTSSSQSMKKIK